MTLRINGESSRRRTDEVDNFYYLGSVDTNIVGSETQKLQLGRSTQFSEDLTVSGKTNN